ncbi:MULTISPECIES: hypothetical protein [unclassified Niallia]|uniref:hypothetical protein n=1 Tax=unclassified Niallia TaxID=2837522 RepID=UPI001EDC19E5|nr:MULTISPECIES: hypothetical protein [unclassified Niallia]MCM3029783.1 hypothetical protein [Niallia sp. MER 6]UPO87308.1 hypothetical protein L8T27_017380 [Niallia sp. Man26]
MMNFPGSESDYLYEPLYVCVLLLLLGLIFFGILLYCVLNIKFHILGYVLLTISFVTYLLVGIYMVGKGYYYDTDPREGHIFREYGFLELILLTYPYIFLTLACCIGQKKSAK